MREGQQKNEGLAKSQFSININIKWSNSLQTWRSNEENIDGTQRNQSLLIQNIHNPNHFSKKQTMKLKPIHQENPKLNHIVFSNNES